MKVKLEKFLLDENMTYNHDNDNSNTASLSSYPFFKSIELIGCGASDEKIFQYAKKNNMTVITKDKRFALHMIMKGYKTIIMNDNLKSVLVDPKIDTTQKYGSPLTYYLHEHNTIILP